MKYGIVLAYNVPCSKTILAVQKKTIGIVAGAKHINSCSFRVNMHFH